MLTIDLQDYTLEYSQKRIEIIENKLNKSVMAIFQSGGMMTLAELKTFVAYGLKQIDKTTFVNPIQGIQLAEKLVDTYGYSALLGEVVTAIQRDCGFFFLGI